MLVRDDEYNGVYSKARANRRRGWGEFAGSQWEKDHWLRRSWIKSQQEWLVMKKKGNRIPIFKNEAEVRQDFINKQDPRFAKFK